MEILTQTLIFLIYSFFAGFSYVKYFIIWLFTPAVANILQKHIFPKWNIEINGSRSWDIQVINRRFYPSSIAFGGIGMFDSYLKGWWKTEDLEEFYYQLSKNGGLEMFFKDPIVKAEHYLKWEFLNRNASSSTADKTNKQFDLGNDWFQSFLGETLMYAVAHWDNAKDLNEAVQNNMALLSKKLELRPGLTVLDVGCGYGTLERHMAKNHGVHVVGVVNSKEMGLEAKELCKGLQVKIQIKDWRQVEGTFDRIVIVQTIEYVGAKNYRKFFQKMYDSLGEGGILVMQHFAVHNKNIPRNDPILQTFAPNLQVPRLQEILHASDGLFSIEDMYNMKNDALETYRVYLSNFEREIPSLSEKYGREICQRWKFFLTVTRATIRSRAVHVYQTVFSKQ